MRKILMMFFSLCSFLAQAQVWNGNLYLTSQQEIDDFSSFPYSIVTGSVTLDDARDGTFDITNLAGLAALEEIGGLLTIFGCDRLSNTDFLNLKKVAGISIASNATLLRVSNMPLLQSFGDIRISNNPQLDSITAFDSLTSMSFSIVIYNNPLLSGISGFKSLETFEGLLLEISSVTNLDCFASVKEMKGGFRLAENPLLANIDGLGNMTSCNQLTITNNASLLHLNGLQSLSTVGSFISINNNSALQQIQGLSALIGSVSLDIDNNASLIAVQGGVGIQRLYATRITNNDALKEISGFEQVLQADLLISGNDQLELLSGFDNATVAGDYRVEQNLQLKRIDAFPRITRINRFSMEANIMLGEISPMALLDTVQTDFSFGSDTTITDLNFLPALRFIGGNLFVTGLEKLNDISGLSQLDSVGGNFRMTLFQTSDISALSNLEYISGDFNLGAAYALQNLQGLRNLRKVKGDFSLGGLSRLPNLNDLLKLDSIGGTLYLFNLLELTDLNGLQNLRDLQYAFIQDNPMLNNFCGLYNTFSQTPPLFTQITGNLSNPTVEDIRSGGPCAALPVRWNSVSVRCEEGKNRIGWSTASELNNRYFLVQRSTDGFVWSDLGRVAGAGNSTNEQSYFFYDEQPPGLAYYRIAQVDLDGRVSYSTLLQSNCSQTANFSVWPNPATDRVFVRLYSARHQPAVIQLMDGKGALLQTFRRELWSGQNQLEIDLSGLSSGVYFIEILWDESRQRKRASIIHW